MGGSRGIGKAVAAALLAEGAAVTINARGQGVVGVAGLVPEVQSTATTVAQAADQEGSQQRCLDLVPNRVGDRYLQRLAVEVVVEGVAADGAGWFQPAGEGELASFAGVGGGEQPSLDFGG
jgi:NAD(P)-dependent dehydrogenase (short-subunit alcohol dehydrogenase family)